MVLLDVLIIAPIRFALMLTARNILVTLLLVLVLILVSPQPLAHSPTLVLFLIATRPPVNVLLKLLPLILVSRTMELPPSANTGVLLLTVIVAVSYFPFATPSWILNICVPSCIVIIPPMDSA